MMIKELEVFLENMFVKLALLVDNHIHTIVFIVLLLDIILMGWLLLK